MVIVVIVIIVIMIIVMVISVIMIHVDIVAESMHFPVLRMATAIHFNGQVSTVIFYAGDIHKAFMQVNGGDAFIYRHYFMIQATG